MNPSSPASAGSSMADRFATVRRRITSAAQDVGRDPASVVLTAVTKTQPPEAIDAALDAGQRVFGENRVQEAQARWAKRRETRTDLELRLIGPLQTNKAGDALALFDVIETLDRDRLARVLAEGVQKAGRSPRLLIQVNTGEETQRSGVHPREADGLIAAARDVYGLTIEGLMVVPPLDEPPGLHFALLARIAAHNGLPVLSMGMSDDFEAAIRFGSTHVRLGSALFGERNRLKAPSTV